MLSKSGELPGGCERQSATILFLRALLEITSFLVGVLICFWIFLGNRGQEKVSQVGICDSYRVPWMAPLCPVHRVGSPPSLLLETT